MINYLKVYEDGTKEATKFKPVWGLGNTRTQAGENPDVFVDGKWFSSTNNGVEKVVNGTFDTDISGWIVTTSVGSVIQWENGMLKSTISATGLNDVTQNITVNQGSLYKAQLSVVTNSTHVYFSVTTSDGVSNIANTAAMNGMTGVLEIEFIAPSSEVQIYVGFDIYTNSYIDNISVFETEIIPDTPYISQPTYLSQNGKLLEVEVNNGVPSTLQANEDAPKIVEECIQSDVMISSEYKGKNACTAWVNFDGTTTPPTIRDSFNVSDVARLNTGRFRCYTNLDNNTYSGVVTGSVNGDTQSQYQSNVYNRQTSYFDVVTTEGNNATWSNISDINVHIFGGRN